MSRLLDRLLHRHTLDLGTVTCHLAGLGPAAAAVQTCRGETFATSLILGRASIHVGLLPAIESGLHDAVEAGPVRIRWIRRDPGLSGAIALLWDSGPKAATR